MGQFRAWRLHVRNTVTAASGRGPKGFEWIMRVEEPGTKDEDLAESGEKFISLDDKLGDAIQRIMDGDISKRI